MKALIYTAPTIEPITLAELKLHLRIDSESFADNIDTSQCIVPGSHAITVGYALLGTAVEVIGYTAVVNLNAGTNGATGTVDVKIQESDDNATWTDWAGGAFTQVTTANDNAIQEKAYTGAKRYIRVACRVLLAACEFSVDIVRQNPTTAEDTLLNNLITTSREYVEDYTRRALLTQTWNYYLDEFPDTDFIELPWGNLQSVTSIAYKDTDGVSTTMTVTTDYLVETNGEQKGRIVLPYGGSWPSESLYPSNPITIQYVCGWTAAASVPWRIKAAMLMLCADMHENRGEALGGIITENKAADRLLWPMRLW